ncbi:uncharacterized protein isoform X2 [Rhodnius prolixus]|uniref:uncharacterized protein isoform X2 n=1 Tax=Rhodnius prolixus TaxID=13249 RepID=UPI003D189242
MSKSQKTDKNNEDKSVIIRRIEELHLCEKTRPRWLDKIDYDDEESPLDKEFPLLPLSDESMEIYKNFRTRWKSNLTKEEKETLFGSDVSSDEDLITVLCDTCKPKILSKESEPKKRTAASLFKKFRSINLLKDSRLKFERQMKLDRAEEAKQEIQMKQPRDILKNIMEEAIKEVKQETNMLPKDFVLPVISEHDVISEDDENLSKRDEWEEDFDEAEEYDLSSDESESISTCLFAKDSASNDKHESSENPAASKSSDELVRKMYLKPEEPTRKCGKARYENESTAIKEVNLLEKLDRHDLKELKNYFFPKNAEHHKVAMEYEVKNDAKYDGVPLKKRDFMEAIDNVIGVKEYTLAAGKLFESLEANHVLSEGVLWWEQFLDLIITSRTTKNQNLPFIIEEDHITNFIPFSKTPIIRIVQIECNRQLTYAALSRLGEVAVLNEKLILLHSYRIPINQYKSKKCCWLTDACYSSQTETLFVVASTRCLYLYSTSRIVHKLIQTVSGIWEIPECIQYTGLRRNQALLLMGDNKGNIINYLFKQTNKSYFKLAPDKGGEQYYFWDDIIEQTDWVEISVENNIHNDVILQIEYIPKSDCIVSCSLDSRKSVAIRHRQPNRTPYIFIIEKGVKCFRYDQKLGVLATVSGDNMARLWDPVNTTRPLALLKGHREPVLDVSLVTSRRIAVTYAVNKELKIWDIETYACLQTLKLNFQEVPYSMHLLLNIRALYLDVRMDFKSHTFSQTSSKASTNENSYNFQYSTGLRHLIVVNINNIKMFKINCDAKLEEVEEVMFESQISEEAVLDRSENPEYNSEMELLEFFKNTFLRDGDLDKHRYFKGRKSLYDFVKEGTPHLALKLQDVVDI